MAAPVRVAVRPDVRENPRLANPGGLVGAVDVRVVGGSARVRPSSPTMVDAPTADETASLVVNVLSGRATRRFRPSPGCSTGPPGWVQGWTSRSTAGVRWRHPAGRVLRRVRGDGHPQSARAGRSGARSTRRCNGTGTTSSRGSPNSSCSAGSAPVYGKPKAAHLGLTRLVLGFLPLTKTTKGTWPQLRVVI